MTDLNKEYYIPFNKMNDRVLRLGLSTRSSNRFIGIKPFEFGEPLFFENDFPDLTKGIDFELSDIHLSGNDLIVSNKIKSKIEFIENEKLQFFPAVIINNNKYHENYWVINIHQFTDILDYEKCDIDDDAHDIDKFSIDIEKYNLIPRDKSLVIKPDGTLLEVVFVHKSIVEALQEFDTSALNFFSVDEWEMGYQFVE